MSDDDLAHLEAEAINLAQAIETSYRDLSRDLGTGVELLQRIVMTEGVRALIGEELNTQARAFTLKHLTLHSEWLKKQRGE